MPCAIFEINAFVEQKLLGLVGAFEYKFLTRTAHNAFLHGIQFDFQNLPQMLIAQAAEDHHLINAVHEFRRKLAPRRFQRRAINLLIYLRIHDTRFRGKANATRKHLAHFACAKVGGHNHDGARKIYAAVVAQCERRFIQNAEQQLPQRIAGFFNFIKEDERKFDRLTVRTIYVFLGQHRRGFAVAEIAWGRADQLRNFVRMLKLRAINFCHEIVIAE